MEKKKVKYLILGGGSTGLSVAHFLEKANEKDYRVLEKENIVGGMIRDLDLNGYPVSVSGHWLHISSEENLKFFKSKLVHICQKLSIVNYQLFFFLTLGQ